MKKLLLIALAFSSYAMIFTMDKKIQTNYIHFDNEVSLLSGSFLIDYKGYLSHATYNNESKKFSGELVDSKGGDYAAKLPKITIRYEGKNMEETTANFKKEINRYLHIHYSIVTSQ